MGQKINIIIDQGASFVTTFNISDDNDEPINLSGYSSKSVMRQTYTSSITYPITTATYSNGAIVATMTANATNNIPAGRYVYDIELTDVANNVSRVIEGMVIVTPGVTR